MRWYRVAFSVAEASSGRAIELQDKFSAVFLAFAAPADAAMFKSRDVMENFYYFSPGAARIAMPLIAAYAGVECLAPTRSALYSLVVSGDASAVPFSN